LGGKPHLNVGDIHLKEETFARHLYQRLSIKNNGISVKVKRQVFFNLNGHFLHPPPTQIPEAFLSLYRRQNKLDGFFQKSLPGDLSNDFENRRI